MIEAVGLLICLQRLATPKDAERSRSAASSDTAKFVLWEKVQRVLGREENSFRGRIERHGLKASSKSGPTQTMEPS